MFLGVVVVVAAIGGRLPAVVTALAALAHRRLVPDPAVPVVRDRARFRRGVPRRVRGDRLRRGGRRRAGRTPAGRGAAIAHGGRHRVRARGSARATEPAAGRGGGDPRHAEPATRSRCSRPTVTAGRSRPPPASRRSRRPRDGEHYELRDGHVLVMTGPPLRADEQRLVAALLSYLEAILAMHRLQGEASTAESLSQANDLRDALLAAVSHDLRTPLASIKALTSGWLEPDVDWSRADTARVHAQHRRRSRSAPQAGREPARHEPPAVGRARAREPAGRRSTRSCRPRSRA